MEEIKIRKKLLTLIFILMSIISLASDVNIQLSEKAITSFIVASSPIKFQKDIKVIDQKTQANFVINNLIVNLKKDKIYVEGKLNLELNGSKLEANINGELEPSINKETGELNLTLRNVDIKGLEFLKLDEILSDHVKIPLNITDLKPIKIKQSEKNYKEVIPQITNEKIEITEDYIKVTGDLSFSQGEIKEY